MSDASSNDPKAAQVEAKAAKARAKALRPWYRKKRFWLLGLVVLIVIISVASNSGKKSATPQSNSPATTAASNTPATTAAPATTSAPSTTAGPTLTQQQQSAVASAHQYLNTESFSQQGLIAQLDSSAGGGYSVNDATVAVDSLTVNWNTEAVQSAKQYLSDSALFMQRPNRTTGLVGRWPVHGRSGYVWSDAGRRLLVRLQLAPDPWAEPTSETDAT